MGGQIAAIVWAQYRAILNSISKGRGGPSAWLSMGLSAVWYGGWLVFAGLIVRISGEPGAVELYRTTLAPALLLGFLYWQVIPVILVSMGSALDMKRLLPYPIPAGRLFAIEVVLRLTTAIETVAVVLGLMLGLLLNYETRLWAVAGLLPFLLFNLLLSCGTRELLTRLLARKRVREVLVLLFVLALTTPQVLAATGFSFKANKALLVAVFLGPQWPWTAAAHLAIGDGKLLDAGVLLGWTALAFWFGRNQFERGLRFDASERRDPLPDVNRRNLFGTLVLPLLERLPDPLSVLMEKEARLWLRSSRFRLVFVMGFTFGLLVWVPMAVRSGNEGFYADHFLAWVTLYAVMLLGEVCFWNVLGFDRGAAQAYFVLPVPLRQVIIAKNLLAGVAVLLEVAALTVVCLLLRVNVTPGRVLEAVCGSLVFALFLMALGNVASVRNPRASDPGQSWRTNSAGKVQAMLLVIYPVAVAPLALAFLARYATEQEWAFYGTLGVMALAGGIFYHVALDSAVQYGERQREHLVGVLSKGTGPISS